jgi:phage shock protein E
MKPFLSLLCVTLMGLTVAVQARAEDKKPPGKAPAGVQNVTVADAAKLVAEKKVVVLDIRTPEEFQGGHIAGAKNIDFLDASFEKQLSGLDRGKSYLVHCASGGRSGKSLDLFKKMKFESVYHLNAGFNGWSKEGKPVEK